MKHKHHKEIIAWANGAKVELRNHYGDWVFDKYPAWNKFNEYRVMRKPNYKIVKKVISDNLIVHFAYNDLLGSNVSFTFDGETNELIGVEMLK